jgi:hypothetical protein
MYVNNHVYDMADSWERASGRVSAKAFKNY